MITLIATGSCSGCDWTTGPVTMAEADKATDKHTSEGHPTVIVAEPAPKAP